MFVALARDEDIDPRVPRGRLATVIRTLDRRAEITVAPRFGAWDPALGVVVPPAKRPAA
jgi:hypothetical protein